tara:strand:+ start:600 stop:1229 length:630 start_codon:yes stop_codon:yes gene_type:complete
MLSLYVPGDTVIHRVPAGIKLLILVIGSMALFVISNITLHVAELLSIAILFQIARLPWKDTLRQLRTALIFMIPIFLFHVFLTDWILGLETILRILVLLMLAILITLTTKVSDMMDVLEWAVFPLKQLGVNPSKVSMMLSMVIRFIPMMMREAQEILEAQRARGLERNAIALLMPLLIKTLKMADDLSEAIEARAYDPERVIPIWKRGA